MAVALGRILRGATADAVLLVGVAVKLSSLLSHCFVIAGRLTAVSLQAANHLLN